jgi:hypothetical protein
VYVGRPTKWGNPYLPNPKLPRPKNYQSAVNYFRERIESDPDLLAQLRRDLRGCDLACWCPLDQPCHADVLLELANTTPDKIDA